MEERGHEMDMKSRRSARSATGTAAPSDHRRTRRAKSTPSRGAERAKAAALSAGLALDKKEAASRDASIAISSAGPSGRAASRPTARSSKPACSAWQRGRFWPLDVAQAGRLEQTSILAFDLKRSLRRLKRGANHALRRAPMPR